MWGSALSEQRRNCSLCESREGSGCDREMLSDYWTLLDTFGLSNQTNRYATDTES